MTVFVYAWRESDVSEASIVVHGCDDLDAATKAIRSALSPLMSEGGVIEIVSLDNRALPLLAKETAQSALGNVKHLAELCADPRKAAA